MHVTGTTPYPWPYDGGFGGPGTALLLVGPTDPRAPEADTHTATTALAAAATRAGAVIITVSTTVPDAARRRGAGAPSGEWSPDSPGIHLTGRGVDAFYGSDLDLVLTQSRVRCLVLAGSALELAVHSTLRSANDRGIECLLVIDACTVLDPALASSSRWMVETSGGIFGAVGLTADVVAAWTAVAPAASPSAADADTTSPTTQGALS